MLEWEQHKTEKIQGEKLLKIKIQRAENLCYGGERGGGRHTFKHMIISRNYIFLSSVNVRNVCKGSILFTS